MSVLPAHDGTKLAYNVLGGLAGRVRLILFDYRGTGQSETPIDATSYRCDHLVADVEVADVEARREHLGLDRIDLLAHSAGANLAALYAARHPERIGKLALVAPSSLTTTVAAFLA